MVLFQSPGIPTTIKTLDVNITTIAYLRVLIIGIGSTIILMVVEAQGEDMLLFVPNSWKWKLSVFEKVTTIGDTPILQFHDYGRKGSFLGGIVTFHYY